MENTIPSGSQREGEGLARKIGQQKIEKGDGAGALETYKDLEQAQQRAKSFKAAPPDGADRSVTQIPSE